MLTPQAGPRLTLPHSMPQREKTSVLPVFPSTIVQERSFLAVLLSPKHIYHTCNAYLLLVLNN